MASQRFRHGQQDEMTERGIVIRYLCRGDTAVTSLQVSDETGLYVDRARDALRWLRDQGLARKTMPIAHDEWDSTALARTAYELLVPEAQDQQSGGAS